jgi:hypothetical protein
VDPLWLKRCPSRFTCILLYSVCDRDCVLALSKDIDPIDVWEHGTEDRQAFSERMRTIMNPMVSYELSRLKDLRLSRLSERRGVFRTVASRHRSLRRRPEVKGETLLADYKLEEPCSVRSHGLRGGPIVPSPSILQICVIKRHLIKSPFGCATSSHPC